MEKNVALLIVDIQIDFCPGGSLGVPEGDTIIPVINRYIELFSAAGLPVIATRDWHPPVTSHFRQYGGLWPPHCVQGSEGAQFHPLLRLPAGVTVVSKGMNPEKDDYSAFHALTDQGAPLADLLDEFGTEWIYIGGLATDYCVRESVLEGVKQGFSMTVLKDAVRGVDLNPGDSARALRDIASAGAELADFSTIEQRFLP